MKYLISYQVLGISQFGEFHVNYEIDIDKIKTEVLSDLNANTCGNYDNRKFELSDIRIIAISKL